MGNLTVKFFINGVAQNELEVLINRMKLEDKDSFEIDVIKNVDFNESRNKEFPDGFLYFPLIMEYYSNDTKISDINNTRTILIELWKNNISAVASCDFENELPENGGYKSKAIPWMT
jgi:hypothetical protein